MGAWIGAIEGIILSKLLSESNSHAHKRAYVPLQLVFLACCGILSQGNSSAIISRSTLIPMAIPIFGEDSMKNMAQDRAQRTNEELHSDHLSANCLLSPIRPHRRETPREFTK
eukprot:scaffold14836_cov134-Cylindrotheca_fusiformis.AAC.7